MNIEEFIKLKVGSVDTAQVLLLLLRNPERKWTGADISSRLRLPPQAVKLALEKLSTEGLLAGEPSGSYAFQPQTAELTALMAQLGEMDRERPVTLIKMIYDQTRDIQAFADAFKITRNN